MTGELRPVAPFAGEISVGTLAADGHPVTLNLRCTDEVTGQVAPSTVSTHHSVTPVGMTAVYSVSLVVVSRVVALLPLRMALRRYSVAPATGSQSNLTSAVTPALSSGASSFAATGQEVMVKEEILESCLPAAP